MADYSQLDFELPAVRKPLVEATFGGNDVSSDSRVLFSSAQIRNDIIMRNPCATIRSS